jgi:hypothetical protein
MSLLLLRIYIATMSDAISSYSTHNNTAKYYCCKMLWMNAVNYVHFYATLWRCEFLSVCTTDRLALNRTNFERTYVYVCTCLGISVYIHIHTRINSFIIAMFTQIFEKTFSVYAMRAAYHFTHKHTPTHIQHKVWLNTHVWNKILLLVVIVYL